MTTITITKSSDDTYKAVECSGHAGFADAGSDIVCAAVSVLTINTVNSIEQLTTDRINVVQDEESGLIRFTFNDKPSENTDLLLKSFELGINGIYQQYGKKFLNIKFRRE